MQAILHIPFHMNICTVKWFNWVLTSGKRKANCHRKTKEATDPTPLNLTCAIRIEATI